MSASPAPAEGEGVAGRSGLDEIKVSFSQCLISYPPLHYMPRPHSQSKVNSLVGSECLYCGDRMIETIDLPFIPPEHMERALASWK